MVDFQCNFQHTNKLDGLVLLGISKMDRMVMVSMAIFLAVFPIQGLELNGTIQMDFLFRQGYSYKLDCD